VCSNNSGIQYIYFIFCLYFVMCRDFGDELSYVNLLISMDVRNNSAWNQRYFVISNSPFSKDTLNSELEYTWANAEVAMLNESPWNYLRG